MSISRSDPSRRWRERLPAAMIPLLIVALSVDYAGYRISGYALIHCVITTLLMLSFLLPPPRRRRRKIPAALKISILLMAAIALVNLVTRHAPAKGTDIFIFWIDLLMTAWIILRTSRKHLMFLLVAWLGGSTLVSILHFIMMLASASGSFPFPPWLKHGYHYGFYAVLVIFSGLGMHLAGRRPLCRHIGLAAAVSSLVALVMDFKSAPVIGAAAGLAMSLIFFPVEKTGKRQRIMILLIFAVTLSAGFLSMRDFMFHDLRQQLHRHGVTSIHPIPMGTALRVGMAHPLAGAGIGNFEFVSGAWEPPGLQDRVVRAHNSVLELFAETGIAGVIPAGLILFFLVHAIRRRRSPHILPRRMKRGLVISLVSAGILAVLDFGLQMPANALTVVFLLAVLLADALPSEPVDARRELFYRKTVWGFVTPILVMACIWMGAAFLADHARALASRGQYPRAVRSLELAVRLRTHDDRNLAELGRTRLRLAEITGKSSDFSAADTAFSRSLALNPRQADLWYARALLPATASADRRKYLRNAANLDPNNLAVSVALMEDDARAGELDGLFRELTRILGRAAEKDTVKLTDAFAAMAGFSPGIVTELRRILPGNPVRITIAFARSMEKAGEPRIARDILRTTVDRNDYHEKDWEIVARMLNRLGDREGAKHVCVRGLGKELSPAVRIRLLKYQAGIFMGEGAFAAALEPIRELKRLRPDDVRNRVNEIICEVRSGKSGEDELNALEDLVTAYPVSAEAHHALADALARRGEMSRSLEEYRVADDLSGGEYQKDVARGADRLKLDSFWR